MSSEDWYRNENWNASIEEHFYSKLKRTRTQRDQYLVIQALTLADTYPEVSLRLVNEYFESRKDQFDDIRALLAKANEYANAVDVLNEHVDRLTFPLDYYKWHASKALINNDGSEAQKALDAAKVKRSGFRFHQDVGLVGKEHEKTIKHLCKIST